MSDHGHKHGDHTNYGFYSFDMEMKLEDDNPLITDFYPLLKKIFKVPPKEDEQKIKQKLRDLGYG